MKVRKQKKKGTVTAIFVLFTFCFLFFGFFLPTAAQRVAILSPDKADSSRNFAERLETQLAQKLRIVDDAMSESAFASIKAENSFNMTVAAAKAVGAAIGCDYFILVRSGTLRRSSSTRAQYYESYAVIYVVSSRTGRLIFWKLLPFEADKPQDAQNQLDHAVSSLVMEIEDKLRSTTKVEMAERPPSEMEEPPDEGSPTAKNFRAPIPYLRIKPEYTADAFLYDIEATVDIIVDLNERGSILRTEIVRWTGFGLDESVEKAVRSMDWRPSTRNGKPLPMRFLLRYNFKKLEKEKSVLTK